MPLSHASKYSELTDQQYTAIGKIMVESSNIEHLIERILIRLCRTPDFLGLTLTNPIGAVRRIECLKILTDVHRRRYNYVDSKILDKIDDLRKEIDSFRIDRNKFAHFCWCRSTDQEIFGLKFTGKMPSPKMVKKDCITFSLVELDKIITRLREIVDEMESLLDALEKAPE